MKKGIIFIILMTLLSVNFPGQEVQSAEEYQTIPDEAIRLRILANSDQDEDQQTKRLVRDEVNHYITELVQYMDNISEARSTIREHLPEIEDIVAHTLKSAGTSDGYKVEFRKDVAFPTKIYDHLIYPAGEYEAVLISIGEGKGANWWCVLFPPLCFLDFSNGSVVSEPAEDEQEVSQPEETVTEQEADDDAEMLEDNDELLDEDWITNDEQQDEDVKVGFFLFDWFGWS